MELFLKDPVGSLDYSVAWGGEWLAGRSIVSSDWSVLPVEAGGIVCGAAAVADGVAAVSLSGGIAGRVYRVSNQVTLSDGARDARLLLVRVEAR
ncbi:phage fiber-tail adaptor protein [Sandaracinobacteroides saxicola]|uniref:Uncharacterized protein n=1 Tax=Sandaracinobacteroides saxicola TaxID=2759707 RepID=A0A7G5IJ40_9SPHN|nr:hypothetical protein [Sandaracinobacteroides saxicola]QMW23382.1 hypothetical protein H3309_02445 [Sandaracinobacteroides saxicola]